MVIQVYIPSSPVSDMKEYGRVEQVSLPPGYSADSFMADIQNMIKVKAYVLENQDKSDHD